MNKKIFDSEYVKGYYDEFLKNTKEEYANFRWFSSDYSRYEYKQTRRTIMGALGPKKYSHALEVGPGDGIWTEIFAKLSNDLTALDISSHMMGRAKKRLRKFSNIKFVHEDFISNTLPSDGFDLLCAIRCFEYFPDKEKSVRQMHRVLKSGGTLIIVTKNPFYRWRIFSSANPKLLHSDQISLPRLKGLLNDEGFIVKGSWPAILGKKLGFAPARFLFGMIHKICLSCFGWIVPRVFQKYFAESFLIYAVKKW